MISNKSTTIINRKDTKNIFQKIKNNTNDWIVETCNMNVKNYKESKEYKSIEKITKKN
jgi:hypothetical protein